MYDHTLKTQGERLKYVRKQNNKTQQQVGELLHLSRDHVSRLERNKCDPTGSTIDLFCTNLKHRRQNLLFRHHLLMNVSRFVLPVPRPLLVLLM